ncbi:hypothetical protein J0H58_16990 [bacterium]|nr:hypothetical protein [bacterium]
MRFLVPPCALVLAVVLSADVRSQPGPKIQDGKAVLQLTVSSAAPPVPALRYALLPTHHDIRPGNQILAFYKCFMEQDHLFNKEAVEKQDKWYDAPLADLKGVKELEGYGGYAVAQAHRAARMEYADWQVAADIKQDGVMTLLPDLHKLRQLSRILRVRARGEIARGDFPAAVETIQTQMALARTHNDHPTLIGMLVGVSITAMAMASVEEFVAQPGAPNLFWALTDLPAPLFDLRKAIRGERLFIGAELDPFIDRVNPMSEAQVGRAVTKITELMDMIEPPKEGLAAPSWSPPKDGKVIPSPPRPARKTPATYLGERAADAKQVEAARAKLLPTPPTRDLRIEKFPPMQVILIDELNRYEVARDDAVRWLCVPPWQLPVGLDKKPDSGLFTPLAPAIQKVAFVRGRIQQQVAMLQVVEGVRVYAAANGGRLPGALAEVPLPLPLDPFTNRPFVYEPGDGVAAVRGTPPPGGTGDPMLNRVYEVRLRK